MIALPSAPIAVCERCAVQRLDAALRAAPAGGTIVVRGVQHGNFVIRRPVTLEGAPGARIEGTGRGTVLLILAAGVTVRGLAVAHSGSDFVAMDSAIRSNEPHTTIENDSISDALFGVYFAHADDSRILGNRIAGRRGVDLPDRGDALRVWYSHDVRIAHNTVTDARDDLIWFSRNVTVDHNHITGGRYGIHTMYSDGMTVASNVVRGCEIGSYAMYGRHVTVENNVFADNRGSTGYGIGMKDMDDAAIAGNAFVSNHAGVYVDDSPSLVGSVVRFDRNLFAYNDIGLAALPSSHGDTLSGNTFEDNYRQVSVLGGGTLRQLTWTGNSWSDYAGFDRNGDGTGDIAYRLQSVYGTLSDLNEQLDLLAYSPAAKALDFAVNALPLFAPPVTLVDKAPLMQPAYPQRLPAAPRSGSPMRFLSAGLLALFASFGVLVPFRPRRRTRRARSSAAVAQPDTVQPAIEVRRLEKCYGSTKALNGIDLTVMRGETVGLWGPNGSGKSTLMRCLLGLISYSGEIRTHVRLGYVPQHLPAFDMRVREFAAFVAGLRGCAAADADAVLQEAALFDLRERNVGDLSGGQRERLAVAVAALGDPDALLLDEPTVGLDVRSRGAILNFLSNEKRKGKTIVISSHVPEDLTALADRVVVLDEGRVTGVLSPAAFLAFVRARREEAAS